jgi:hypothetical protein
VDIDCFVCYIIMQPQDMGWKGTNKLLLLLLNFWNHINNLKVIQLLLTMKIFYFLDSIHAFTHTVCNTLSNSEILAEVMGPLK